MALASASPHEQLEELECYAIRASCRYCCNRALLVP